MDIIIQHLGFQKSESLENFIREKVSALKSDTIVRANVTLYLASAGNPENEVCEIRLEIPGNDLYVKKGAVHFEISVTDCIDVLQTQLKKLRDKSTDRRHANEDKIQDELVESANDDAETELEDIVK